jgi:molecular chaperone GrpE
MIRPDETARERTEPGREPDPENPALQAAADQPDSAIPPPQTADAKLQQLEALAAEANQRAMRACAELENFRKRMRREMDEERRYAALPVLRDLLAVVDNLQRAVAAADDADKSSALLQGVQMVADQLARVLQQHHCREIAAQGTRFDPNLHEALAQQPTAAHPPGTVLEVTRAGYQLHDRVIRPAQVLVAAAPAPKNDVELEGS